MKINFIGGFFPKDKIHEYLANSSGVVHFAADNLQQAMIAGLGMHEDVSLKLFTIPFLSHYPEYNKIQIQGTKTVDYQVVPFINLKMIDSITKTRNLKKTIKKEIKNEKDNVILIYGLYDYFLQSILKHYDNKVCLIIPDLPRMMGGDLNKLKIKIYIWYIEKVINRNLYKVDCFIFISEHMKEYIDVKNKPWIVIEGIYNNQTFIPDQVKEKGPTVLYTGTLDKRYGITDLLEAFRLIDDDGFSLWICGEGAGRSDVEEAARKDKRIKYFGQIRTEEVQILLRKATVLVNPRKNDLEYTKFSFPSKTMEYLASGTPVVMHQLGGIPEEYHEYFFCPADNSALGLKEKIMQVVNLSDEQRADFGKKAQKFIFEYKNPKVQGGKILQLLKGLFSEG